jgi:hypothetical protein
MIHSYFPIGGMLAMFAIVTGFMFITSKVAVWLRASAAALAVVLAVGIWLNATSLIGFPVNGEPQDSGVVIGLLPDKHNNVVYAWVFQEDGPRAYQMPYGSKEGQELMQAMQRAKASGGVVTIKKKGKKGSAESRNSKDEGRSGGGSPIQSDSTIPVEITVIPLLPAKE